MREFTSITDTFIATEPDNPRKLDAESLKTEIQALGASCESIHDCRAAVREASEKAAAEDFDAVLYAGSLYMIGAVRGLLRQGE